VYINLKITMKKKPELQSLTIVFNTILAFVRSVAVHSMKTFLVFRVIAECAPLIIGGRDKTVLQKET